MSADDHGRAAVFDDFVREVARPWYGRGLVRDLRREIHRGKARARHLPEEYQVAFRDWLREMETCADRLERAAHALEAGEAVDAPGSDAS